MENKINIAELLKDCPKGMELYSPLCGKCVFDRLNMGTIICKKQNTQEIAFTSRGYYMLPVFDNCECMIFPSKDQRDWSKFQRPFMVGDIVHCRMKSFEYISIYKSKDSEALLTYCDLEMPTNRLMGVIFGASMDVLADLREIKNLRLATEEEKGRLFKAIKENGYKWNGATKTLEKLIKSKFKIGDKIRQKNQHEVFLVSMVHNNHYLLDEKDIPLPFFAEDDYELVPNKFDITTLVPVESRVLVRDYDNRMWMPTFWGKRLEGNFNCSYLTTSGCYKYCIPYEENEHLLGTIDDCEEFYKTWE